MKKELQATIMKIYDYSMEQISSYQIPKLMNLLEYKDMDLYNEFKIKFRKNGYII